MTKSQQYFHHENQIVAPQQQSAEFSGSKKSKCDKNSERVVVTTEKKTNTHCSCHVLKNTNSKFKVINCSEISLTNVQRRDNNSLSKNSLQTKTAEMSTFTITILFNKKHNNCIDYNLYNNNVSEWMFSEIQEDFSAMYLDVKNSNKEILKGKTSFYVFVIAWNRVKSNWILNWYLVVSFPPHGYLHFPSVSSTDLAILII